MSIRYLLELECHHIVLGFEHVQSPISCPDCNAEKNLHNVHIHEWHAKCMTTNCPFARWTGISQRLAEQMANAHARSSGHRGIKVSYDPRPEAVNLQQKLRKNKVI